MIDRRRATVILSSDEMYDVMRAAARLDDDNLRDAPTIFVRGLSSAIDGQRR